jgi:CelD/BcsL family acetyltransferase involved in cellulose biosynthesis
MNGHGHSFRVARTAPEFADLCADWAEAQRRAGAVRFFQEFDWHWTWWSAAGRADRALSPYVVVASDANGPAGVLPLMVRRDRRLSTLDWMAGEATDYCDALVARDADPGAVMRAFRAAMASSGAAVADLRQIRPDSAFARLAPADLEPDPREGRAIYVDASHGDEARFMKGLNSELRKTMRRRTKRLAEQTPWRFVQSEDPAFVRAALEFCLRHKRGQLAGDAASQRRHEEQFEPFARALVARDRIGSARIVATAIAAGEGLISAHVGFLDRERMYYYLTAHDPAFERCSPGTLLALETIKACCRARVPVFDMLRGDYAFKWAISKASVPLLAYRRGLTLAGRTYLPIERLARVARRRWRGAYRAPAGETAKAA